MALLQANAALAVPDIVANTVFAPADPQRAAAPTPYMDIGGVWNGIAEVTNGEGDSFSIRLLNQAPGDGVGVPPDETVDAASDLSVSVDLPPGFNLSNTTSFSTTIENPAGFATCALPGDLAISQTGSTLTIASLSATPITLPAQGCAYTFEFGLTTTTSTPEDTYTIDYDWSYDDGGAVQNATIPQLVLVQAGAVIIQKTAVTALAGVGDPVEYNVRVLSSGLGGAFSVAFTDVLGADFQGAVPTIALQSLNPPSPPTPPVTIVGDTATFPYLAPGTEAIFTVQANVPTNIGAMQCPDLLNTGQVVDRLLASAVPVDPAEAFVSVPFDLENPLLSYTPPDINVAIGSTQPFSMVVSNVGQGFAQNIRLAFNGLDAAFQVVSTSPDWVVQGAGVNREFVYVGPDTIPANGDEFLGAGASSTINFNVTVDAATCPGPPGGTIDWVPNYENVCGTTFFPPLAFSSSAVINLPNFEVEKTVSSPAINIGQGGAGPDGTYTVTFVNGNNLAGFPVVAGADNDWTVSDTLPAGLTNVNLIIPPGTAASLLGNLITWSGDISDLSPAFPVLTVEFDLDPSSPAICPAGVPVSNTANLSTTCSVNNDSTAGFIANDNPAGDALLIFNVLGDGNFEAGQDDSDGVFNRAAAGQNNEGEHIPFEVTYVFPAGFQGTWVGSTFAADLGAGSLAAGSPDFLRLINSTVTAEIQGGAGTTTVTLTPVSGGDGTGPMLLNLDSINGAGGVIGPNMEDSTLIFRYTTTAPEGNTGAGGIAVDDVNIGGFIETTTLTAANGNNASCDGSNDFIQGANVNLVRADVGIGLSLNNGAPLEVCQIVPLTISAGDPGNDTVADNLLINLDQGNYQLMENAVSGNPGNPDTDVVFSGGLLAIENDVASNIVGRFAAPNNVEFEVQPNARDYTAAGDIDLFVRLTDPAATILDVDVFYDSNHTSPDIDGDVTLAGRDYTANDSTTPIVLQGQLQMEFQPPAIFLIDQANYDWLVTITNVGTGTTYGSNFTTTLPAGFVPDNSAPIPVTTCDSLPDATPVIDTVARTLTVAMGDIPPGESCIVTVRGIIDRSSCFQPQTDPMNQVSAEAVWGCGTDFIVLGQGTPRLELPDESLQLVHDATDSFCELCGSGEIRLLVNNSGSVELTDVEVIEDLLASGLQYQPNSTFYTVFDADGTNATFGPINTPQVGTTITFNQSNIPQLASLVSAFSSAGARRIEIRYQVNSPGETYVDNDRNIEARGTFDLFCGTTGLPPVSSGLFDVPFRQPQPQVDKRGRNFSARQTAADYADSVFGGTDDIVVWRVDVANSGAFNSDDLEDLLVNDTISPGANFTLQYLCPTEAAADAQAVSMEGGGAVPVAPCIVYAATLDVDDPFGIPGNDEPGAFVDVPAGSSALIYYLGTVLNFCTNETNNTDIEWGCESDSPPAGGINADGSGGALSAGFAAGSDDDSALLSTFVDPNGLQVNQTLTGTGGGAEPVGTKGILTITLTNNSGGTVRDVILTDALPTDYELDLTSLNAPNTPLVVNPAFGVYPGITDVFAADATDPNQPIFTFTSSTQGTVNQANLLRNGDQLILTVGVVRIRPFDNVNDPEVRTENAGDGSDPDYSGALPTDDDNTVSLQFSNTCGTVFTDADSVNLPSLLNVNIDPEDIDVDINPTDPNLLFILSDPAAVLNLDVVVRNNGGHTATDYDTYVTVGNGIDPGVLPAGCVGPVAPPAEIGLPPANPGGILPPAYNPGDSVTFRCELNNPLAASATDTFSFVVQRALPAVSGDLTFRADVLARTTLSDGTAPPDRGAAGYPYYSKDNILARIIGFNLSKTLNGNCSEDNPPPVANSNVQIGEECTYEVEAEWFGFATPGFGNIEVRNVRIYEGALTNNPPAVEGNPGVDPPNLPDALNGQGFISVDTSGSSGGVSVAVQNPLAPTALQETGLAWRLNTITAVGDTEENFVAQVQLRTLNDPINTSAVPNLHAELREDEVNARFDVFFTGTGTSISFNESTAGYPPPSLRTVGVTITEPNVTITKEICNEAVSVANNPANSGSNCQPFVAAPAVVMGDADDTFIYRLTLDNEAASGGAARAPAYDVSIDDTLDASDQLAPLDFATDGLDNDADGLVDAADLNGEGAVDDLLLANGNPADIAFDSSHSTALESIDAGDSVELIYRAVLDTMVTPTQQLINSADGAYDSLMGASGAQSAPLGNNGELGGAREYTIAVSQAILEIDNIVVNPGSKEFIDTSRRDAGLVPGVCASPCIEENAVIGEEVVVELEFTVPLSELRQFALEDNLPPGIECVEAMDVVLPTFNPPAVDPGFSPGGTFPAAVCDADQVRWDLSLAGDQTLQGSGGTMQFDVQARFIARVQNTALTNNGDIIANGGASTSVIVSYRDASNTLVTIPIDEARLTVQEPIVVLTKTMAPIAPATTVDGRDLITVTVQAENTGSAPAYNLRLLDDLTAPGSNLTYVAGSQGGANPPDVIDLTVPNAPVFTFNTPLPPATTFEFTFQVRVADLVQPLEELNNTIFASYASLPSNAVALNAGGVIGLDGAPNGRRIGALPAAGDAVNDYEAQSADFEAVPPLTIAKNDLTPALPPAIGARKNFEIVISLPEGISNSVVVNDDLAAGATSFILENNANFDVVYTFEDINQINGVPVAGFATPADAEAAMVAFTAVDNATGLVTWNFGNVLTLLEDDPASSLRNPRIIINYFARVANDAATFAGVILQNAANSSYINGENAGVELINAPILGPFVVVEPDLVVTKTGPALMSPAVPESFTVTVENIGTSTAWDVTLVDQLPDLDPNPGGMCDAAPVITAIDVAGRALVENVDYTLAFNPAPLCTFVITLIPSDAAAPANNARIDATEILTITYNHILDLNTPSAINLTNIAGATQWLSLDTDGVVIPPETRAYNRVLSDGTPLLIDHEDEHTLLTQGPVLMVSKQVENLTTGEGLGLSVSADAGDTLRYTLQVNNTGPVAGNNIRVLDDPDLLNTPPGYYENFPAGTLTNIIISTAATDNSLASGGVNNSGLLDLTLNTLDACPAPPACPPGSSAQITFEITLDEQILNDAVLNNRASVQVTGFDPSDSNTVQVQLNQSPGLIVEKTSRDLTGDPNILALGDQLEYTLTVRNISNENAVNVILRDQIPANTTYIASSTTLNSVAVADSSTNVSPLTNGLLINSPDVVTPGFMTASPDPAANNEATIRFRVTINSGLVDGTVISNQGIVTGLGENNGLGFIPILSDDPNTPIANDPTQDIVGSGPVVDAQKTVAIISGGGDGTADPGDTLRYTITVFNNGNTEATGVRLQDAVPANTSYVADSVFLNTVAVAQPDGGVSPLATGIDISSDDLTPPLPLAGAGILSPDGSATITFDVTINAGTVAGTIISNQGTVQSNQLPDEPTDLDGNDENGDQTTDIVVGGIPELSITKEVVIVGGGTAQANGQLEFVIRVENNGPVPADNIVISDAIPAQTSYVPASGQINGAIAGVSFAGNVLTADYTSVFGTLRPGDYFLFTFRVQVDAQVAGGQTINNTANLIWNDGGAPDFNASDSASVDIGGAPGVVNLNGRIWYDANHNDLFDAQTEQLLPGWEVRVYFNNNSPTSADTPIAVSPLTGDDGAYSFNGLPPGGPYTVTFALPNSSVALGESLPTVGNGGLMIITDIIAGAGSNVQDENLTVEPNGVVYGSVSRAPVEGAIVRLLRPDGAPVPDSCFITPAHLNSQQGQVTPGTQTNLLGQSVAAQAGFYRFDLNFSDAVNCPPGRSNYRIDVTVPNDQDFIPGVSGVIPPDAGPLNIDDCTAPGGQPVDAVPPPPVNSCEMQAQGAAPDPLIPRGSGTRYFLDIQLGQTSQNLFNNHIPLDPVLDSAISISKTTPLKNVVKGQLVPYTITLSNTFNFALTGVFMVDNFPAGFKYVEGSATVGGVSTEPQVDGLELTWSGLRIDPLETLTIKLLLIVGAGVGEGEYINTAQAFIEGLVDPVSGLASATVRVVPDPTFDCSDIIGKVYDDRDANGYQDNGEPGIAGAKVITAQGLISSTDQFGRFHIVCAVVPNPDRGSNFIIKLDERSLPSGFRVTTENPRVQRLTRGKAVKFNFGATIHRVVRLDLANAAFEPGSAKLQEHWEYVIDDLFEQLRAGPSILRLSYLGDQESSGLAAKRIKAVERSIEKRWDELNCCYNLMLETEVFWRTGKPGRSQ